MSKDSMANRVAEIYAHPLLELAADEHLIDAVRDDLNVLSGLLAEEKSFAGFLVSPYFAQEAKTELVQKVFADRLNDLTVNFLQAVIKHNRETFLPQIIARYDRLCSAHHGYQLVKVTAASPMSDERLERLRDDLASALNCRVELQVCVDPFIIGGIIIRYAGKLVDNSIRGRIHRIVADIADPQKRQKRTDEVRYQ